MKRRISQNAAARKCYEKRAAKMATGAASGQQLFRDSPGRPSLDVVDPDLLQTITALVRACEDGERRDQACLGGRCGRWSRREPALP